MSSVVSMIFIGKSSREKHQEQTKGVFQYNRITQRDKEERKERDEKSLFLVPFATSSPLFSTLDLNLF